MIVADKLCPCYTTKVSIKPTMVEYEGPGNNAEYCRKLKYNVYRRKPDVCLPYHPEVNAIISQF